MCNREAPAVEQFARQHSFEVTVVGIGTQDGLDEAKKFHARHQITFPLLWDEGFTTWDAFDIANQPAAVLLDRNGASLKRWFGMFDPDEVLELARAN